LAELLNEAQAQVANREREILDAEVVADAG